MYKELIMLDEYRADLGTEKKTYKKHVIWRIRKTWFPRPLLNFPWATRSRLFGAFEIRGFPESLLSFLYPANSRVLCLCTLHTNIRLRIASKIIHGKFTRSSLIELNGFGLSALDKTALISELVPSNESTIQISVKHGKLKRMYALTVLQFLPDYDIHDTEDDVIDGKKKLVQWLACFPSNRYRHPHCHTEHHYTWKIM